MMENPKPKPYDLEDRTFEFAKQVREFVKVLPRSMSNTEDAKQLVRASGSVAANYIEANEALSKKDSVMRVKICRKEAKECVLWLRLLDVGSSAEAQGQRDPLAREATELMNIFGAIIRKSV